MHKQDIPDTLWIGFGRKDAPIIQQPSRFKDYFYTWMHPHKYKIKHVEFWPGLLLLFLQKKKAGAIILCLQFLLCGCTL